MGGHGENLQRGRPPPNCRSGLVLLAVSGCCKGAVVADEEGRGPATREVFAANGDTRNLVVRDGDR